MPPLHHPKRQSTNDPMKKILVILSSLALAGLASAGCGKTVENKGSLSSYDAGTKAVVVTLKKKFFRGISKKKMKGKKSREKRGEV
jgi:hypothetical protein